MTARLAHAPLALLLALTACGEGGGRSAPQPPAGAAAISRSEGEEIPGAQGWRWVPFPDSTCTDAAPDDLGRYRFGTSTTGLALSWGPVGSEDLVIFFQGGGACWESITCGGAAPLVDKTASTGPFGPKEFASDVHDRYPRSWLRRENLPAALRDATIVFVPYCTGDVHAGDRVGTYPAILGGPAPIWHHAGLSNVTAFLRRLAATFPAPRKLVVAGASAGGFGTLAHYERLRAQWPAAKGYLVDDSAPPLVADAIPAATRAGWYQSWGLGAALDPFCAACRDDLSAAVREIARRHPEDRIALVSHLEDEVIRGFYGSIVISPSPAFEPMDAARFASELRVLGTTVFDPATPNAKYFFITGSGHPTLDDPAAITTPAPGLAVWLELMVSDSPEWASASD